MRTFIILWLGQMVSSIGSSMTYFALTLWVWQQTESVTAIALITVFFQIPQIALALVSGIIVDRFSRKQLLLLSDIVTACCSLLVGVLYATEHLQLGYLYAIASLVPNVPEALQTTEGWSQFTVGFLVGGVGGAIFAYLLLNNLGVLAEIASNLG